jgi:hypothetical protein
MAGFCGFTHRICWHFRPSYILRQMKVIYIGRRPKIYLFEAVVKEIEDKNTEKQGTFLPTST